MINTWYAVFLMHIKFTVFNKYDYAYMFSYVDWQRPKCVRARGQSQRPFDEKSAVGKSLPRALRDIPARECPRKALRRNLGRFPIKIIVVQLLRFFANIAITKAFIMARLAHSVHSDATSTHFRSHTHTHAFVICDSSSSRSGVWKNLRRTIDAARRGVRVRQ